MIPENDPDIVRKTLDLQQKGVADQKATRAQNGTGGPQPRDLEKPLVLTPSAKLPPDYPATRKPGIEVFPDTQNFPIIDWNSLEQTSHPNGPEFEQKAIYPADSILAPYMNYARAHIESDDAFIIGSILPVCAALLSRNLSMQWGDRHVYPNLFTMLAGKPGDRKSAAIDQAEVIARACLPENAFLPKSFSPETLFDEYDPECGGRQDKLWIVDDANATLRDWEKTVNGERNATRFLELYDCKHLSESFRRNKTRNNPNPRRYIPITSTSLVFGATFNVAAFQGQAVREGLARRFNYYVADGHGRLIVRPRFQQFSDLKPQFEWLSVLVRQLDFSPDALTLWKSYQTDNRRLINETDRLQELELSRLSSAPMQALSVAIIFEACRCAATRTHPSALSEVSLELAIEHINQCLAAARFLDSIAHRATYQSKAESLLETVRHDYRDQSAASNAIYLTRSEITRRYAPNSSRNGALTPDELYLRIIPRLIHQGSAKLIKKTGKLEVYAFRKEDHS
jgi:hypothetical protein